MWKWQGTCNIVLVFELTVPCGLSSINELHFSALKINFSENLAIRVFKILLWRNKNWKAKNALKYATNVLKKQQIPLNMLVSMISKVHNLKLLRKGKTLGKIVSFASFHRLNCSPPCICYALWECTRLVERSGYAFLEGNSCQPEAL